MQIMLQFPPPPPHSRFHSYTAFYTAYYPQPPVRFSPAYIYSVSSAFHCFFKDLVLLRSSHLVLVHTMLTLHHVRFASPTFIIRLSSDPLFARMLLSFHAFSSPLLLSLFLSSSLLSRISHWQVDGQSLDTKSVVRFDVLLSPLPLSPLLQ